MAGESKQTTNVDEIRQWAEARGGRPAAVAGTGDERDPGILRIDFRDSDDNLEEISWEEFSRAFEQNDLAFVYQNETADGEQSRFNKFVSR
ncbi:MAG: hypothetical protein M3310_02020 [Actinomycetota bacterium]|nr:hypothetical protein [Actinomycetota bacterium]